MNAQEKHEYIDENETIVVIKDETHPLYIVKGERNFLIDSGLTAKAKKYREGISGVLGEEQIDTLLLTHSHFDHVGCASYFQAIYNFEITGSEETVELLKKTDIMEMIDFQNQQLKEEHGDTSDTECGMLKNLDKVERGEKIKISGDRYFEVIAAPGHSGCSIAYLLLPDRILFPGDSAGMMEENGKKRPVFFGDYNDYETTLQQFAEMEPEVVAFSHARPIKGRDELMRYFSDSLAEARKLKEFLLAELMKSRPLIQIAEEFVSREFGTGSVMGDRDAYTMHIAAMANTLKRDFLKTNIY